MVTISPTSIMILMSCGTGTPRTADTSLTVAPELIVTGPVGCTGAGCSARGLEGSRGARASGRGRAACESMTTRRLRLPAGAPPLGLSGL